ncbi:zinc finger protein 483-like [Amblyraja radiata]|uniref:zinc finger protein 483-like n=1 Tax=Amblyraja radiata TaxID=386614 RepID=UPI001403AEE1|nr:zinc finger protein 483-like [Amblyraja radiata]
MAAPHVARALHSCRGCGTTSGCTAVSGPSTCSGLRKGLQVVQGPEVAPAHPTPVSAPTPVPSVVRASPILSNLLVPPARHTGERPYTCAPVRQVLHRSDCLLKHQRTTPASALHLRPVRQGFQHFQQLQQHQRIHTGDGQPYECP